MSQLEQTLEALRNAEAAGRKEDAAKLAVIANRLANSQESAEPKKSTFSNIMGQINKEIAEGVGGMVDLVNPFDQYTGSAETGLKNLMDMANINVAEGEAKTVDERIGKGIGEAASYALPFTAGVKALRGAQGITGAIADRIYPTMANKSGFLAELLAGAGARTAQGEAADRGYSQPVQDVAGLLGGIATGVLPAGGRIAADQARQVGDLALNLPPAAYVARPIANAYQGAKKALAPFTETGAERLVSDELVSGAGGRQAAVNIAENRMAESPLNLTPMQKTGEEYFARVEREAMERDPLVRERIEARRADSDEIARKEFTPEGNVQDAQAFMAQRVKTFTDRVNQYVKAAQQSATTKIADEGADDMQSSVILSTELLRAKNAARTERNRLWNRIPKNQTISSPLTNQAVIAQKKNLGEFSKKDMPPEINQFRKKYAKKNKDIKVKDLLDLYSKLRARSRDASSGETPNSNMARLANEIANDVLEDLNNVDLATDVGRAIAEARDFTRIYHDKFSRGTVGSLLAKKATGDPNVRDELTLEKSLTKSSDVENLLSTRDFKAALSGDEVSEAGRDEGIGAITNFLRVRFDKDVFPNGKFNQSKADSFLEKYNRVLDSPEFASIKTDVENALNTKQKIEDIAQTGQNLVANVEAGTLARFSQSNTKQALDNIFNSQNPQIEMANLVRTAKKDTTGQALNGIKSALSQRVLNNSIDTPQVAANVDLPASQVRGTRLESQLNDETFKSVANQVYTSAELNRLNVITKEVKKLDLARVGRSTKGAISPFPTNKLVEIVGRVYAARQGGSIGGGSAGGSLQTAQILSERMKALLSRLTTNKAEQLMMRAVEDEELFKSLLLDAKNPKNYARIERSIAPYLVGASATLQEQ